MPYRQPANESATPLLAQVRVASPCPAKWEKMYGNDQVRHCTDCRKNVYNLSAMTREDAEALLVANGSGDMCVRFYERADGTIMTADCPVGVERKHRRKMALAVVGGTAMWGMSVLAAASAFARGTDTKAMGDDPAPCALAHVEQPVAIPGYLVINGEAGARVSIDDEIRTTLPSMRITVRPGRHVIEFISADGIRRERHVVDVDSNQTKSVSMTLQAVLPVTVAPVVPAVPEGVQVRAGGMRRMPVKGNTIDW